MTRQRIHAAPFAIASDGSILANVSGYKDETDPEALLRQAMADGKMIFVGTRLGAAEARELLRLLQDPCHEVTGITLGARDRRKRKRVAPAGKTVVSSSKKVR